MLKEKVKQEIPKQNAEYEMFDNILKSKIETNITGWKYAIKLWKANANFNDQNDNDQMRT